MPNGDFAGLSLDLLKTFMVFAETGKVEETARRLGMTQAGVSLQLKKLEEDIGVPLFRPLGRTKALTDFARDLSQSIAPPLTQLAARLREVSRSRLPSTHRRLRIGGRAEIMSRALELLDYPGPILFEAMSADECWKALREDRLDGAFVSYLAERGDFLSKKVFEDRVVFAAPKNFVRARDWAALKNEASELVEKPVAAYKIDPPLLKEFARGTALDLSSLNLKFICEDWNVVKGLVHEGRAWSVLPGSFRDDTMKDVVWIELPAEIAPPAPFYFVYGMHLKGQKLIKT